MNNGIMATVNQSLDQETAVLITTELGHVGNPIQENEAEEKMLRDLLKKESKLEEMLSFLYWDMLIMEKLHF